MDRYDVDTRLAGAYKEEHFADGDGGRVWNGAKKRMPQKRTPLRWAIPLAAAVAVLLTLGAAMPQARAAVIGLYYQTMSIFDYLSMDKTDRPDNTAAASLVQDNVRQILTVTVQPGGEWLKKLKFTIDDVVFDGQYIYIKYTMDPNGTKHFLSEPDIKEGQTAHYKESGNESLYLSGVGEVKFDEGQLAYIADDGVISYVDKFDARGMNLTGVFRGTYAVGFYNATNTMKNGRDEMVAWQPAGTIQAQFSFDATQGRKLDREIDLSGDKHALTGEVVLPQYISGENTASAGRETSLEGCFVAVDTVSVKPTGIDVRVHFYPSARLSADERTELSNMLTTVILGDGKKLDMMEAWTHRESGNDLISDYTIPMEYVGKISTLTVQLLAPNRVAASLQTPASGASAAAPVPTPTAVPPENGRYVVPGATFTIDLTK